MIIFSLARVLGGSLQIATVTYPTNFSLYAGAAALLTIGLSPLLMCALGLLSRVVSNINETRRTFINPGMLKVVELVTLVGLALGIAGGVTAADDYVATGIYTPAATSKASAVLFLASWAAVTLATGVMFCHISAASRSERYILLGIVASIPFLFVRVLYGILAAFSSDGGKFITLTGSTTLLLVMGLIMEAIVVFLYETVGLLAGKHQPANVSATHGQELRNDSNVEHGDKYNQAQTSAKPKQNILIRIAKHTIIYKIVHGITTSVRRHQDVEMQGGTY